MDASGRGTGRFWVVQAGLLAAALLCTWLDLGASSARAGTYQVVECYPAAAPVGTLAQAPDATWSGANGSNLFAVSDCSPGGVGIGAQAGPGFGTSADGTVVMVLGPAPPGAYIGSASITVYHGTDNFDTWWGHADAVAANGGTWALGTGGPGGPTGPYGASFSGQARHLQVYETCAQGGGQVCTGVDYLALKNIVLTMVDTSEPALSVSGSLVDKPLAHGVSSLRIAASDTGSGIAGSSVEVNGKTVAAPGVSCPGNTGSGHHIMMRPCRDLDQTLQYDTEREPWHDGANSLRVCVGDVADSPDAPRLSCVERSVQVDNSCPDSQGADREASSLRAGLQDPKSGALHRSRAVRSTDGVALRGSISDAGAPVRGASVCVYETVDEPAGISQLVQVAKSASSGQFGVNLPPGPSRIFHVAYRYSDHGIDSDSMYLDSSVAPTLGVTKKKLRNGRSVGFRGQLPGPHADGVAVALQAKVGKKWRTFKQVTSDNTGAFRAKYRFTQTRGGQARYVFRALVKKQGGYPYSQGASPKRKVLVRG